MPMLTFEAPRTHCTGSTGPTSFGTNPVREVAMHTIRMLGVVGAVLIAAGTSASLAQRPVPTAANPWFQAAPLPEPSGEVLGVTANGKLYGMSGQAPGFRPRGLVF